MATAAAPTRILTSRPSFVLDGKEEATLSQGLLRMAVVESVQGLYHCEACFGNWGPRGNSIDFLYFDRKKLEFGKTMQVKLEQDKIFDGRIFAIEAGFGDGNPPEITVLLEDRFQDLRMTRRTRSFPDASDADVMRKIAGDHGLQADIDASGPTYKFLTQVNQSDLAFMRERARTIDAEVWVDDRKLVVKSRSKRNNGTVKLNYGGELEQITVTADLATQRTSVTVNGWDVSGKAKLTHEATEQAVSNELNGDTSGISILKNSFGERKESIAHTVPMTAREAQTVAESMLRMTARRFLVARGVAQVNAKLRVGTYLDLQGLGPLFNGKYYLTNVKHAFDGKTGLKVEFIAERPGIGKAQ
jgi:phage protein D